MAGKEAIAKLDEIYYSKQVQMKAEFNELWPLVAQYVGELEEKVKYWMYTPEPVLSALEKEIGDLQSYISELENMIYKMYPKCNSQDVSEMQFTNNEDEIGQTIVARENKPKQVWKDERS